MKKVIVNKCFGGFSLSEKALYRYAEIKGVTLYPEETGHGFKTYWIAPVDERPSEILRDDEFHTADIDARKASNAAYKKTALYDRDIPRDDPALVQAVEELGEVANGKYADLVVWSDDFYTQNPDDLLNQTVELTMVGGEIVYTTGKDLTKS